MNDFSTLIEAYIRKKQEDKGQEYCARSWLDSASKRASQLSVVTHVLKFIHGDAKGSNGHVNGSGKSLNSSNEYISTSSPLNVYDDVVGNAASMDIAGLLLLQVNGTTFFESIIQGNRSLFTTFTDCEMRLTSWMNGFKAIAKETSLSSHTLAKQVYFPVNHGKYHLLAPLYPSSLSQTLFKKIEEARFSDKAKEARECKKKGEYSDTLITYYPGLAIQKFGGTKPQNISYLNSMRKGKSFLLRSAPPLWKSIKRPPQKKSAFWKSYETNAKEELNHFKAYLISVKDRNDMYIRNQITEYIEQLVDLLILTASEIQTLAPGWSQTSELAQHEQIWLDPRCEACTKSREIENWQDTIASTFATWLIQKLKHESLNFSDVEHAVIKDICFKSLKEFEI